MIIISSFPLLCPTHQTHTNHLIGLTRLLKRMQTILSGWCVYARSFTQTHARQRAPSLINAVSDPSSATQAQRPSSHHHSHPRHGSPNSSFSDPASSPHTHTSASSPHYSQADASSSSSSSGAGLWTYFKILLVSFAILLFFNALLYSRVKELENRQVCAANSVRLNLDFRLTNERAVLTS